MEVCLPNLECIGRAFALIVGDRHHDAEHSSTVSKNWEELQKKIEEGARAQLWIRIFKKKKKHADPDPKSHYGLIRHDFLFLF